MTDEHSCIAYCPIRNQFDTHINESTPFRDKVVKTETHVTNIYKLLPKLEKKVDALIWKVVGSVLGLNAGAIIIHAALR